MYDDDVCTILCSNFLFSAGTIKWDTHVSLLTDFALSQVEDSESEERSSNIFHQYVANHFTATEAVQCSFDIMYFFLSFIAPSVYTRCNKINYKIVPETNFNK